MSERNRMFLLIIIMITACLIVAGTSISVLYNTAFKEEQARLMETAQSQARLIEAVARFDAAHYKKWHPDAGDSTKATLSQIIDAHNRYAGFGKTGEFTLSRKEGDKIVFLLSHRHYDRNKPKPVPFESELAEPMRRALLGRSGTVVGLDYRGETVLAAHEPVAELNLGIVAKIDLAEIRAPFIRAGLTTAVFAILVIIAGSGLFLRISNPIIRQLRAEKELNESILNAAMDTILVFDPKTRKPFRWNKIFNEISGYTDEEIAAKKAPGDWYSPEDLEKTKVENEKLLRGEKSIIEMSLITKDGKKIPTEYSASMIYDFSGIPKYILTVGRDITERKQAEEKLRESENRWRRLVEGSPDIVYIYSDKRGASYWSRRVQDILGFSPDDLSEKPFLWHNSIHPDDLPEVDKAIEDSKRGKDFDLEYRIKDINGNWHWFHDRIIGKHITENETIIEGLATDITERKQVAEALQKAHDELELQVAKRTVELKKAVKNLEQEVNERKRTEKEQAWLQQRLEALWKISKMVDAKEQTLYNEVLNQIKDLTQSSYAFFGFLNNDESLMSLYSWSKEVIEDCRTLEKPLEFPISKAGLWGEAVRKRRSFIINDYRKNHPAKKGVPDGHVPITRLLAVPIFSHDRVVSLAVVANKETEYVKEDADQIEAFVANAQIILEWRKTEEARKAAEKELEKQRLRSVRMDRLLSLGEMAAGMAHELNQPLSGVRGLAEHLLIAMDRDWNISKEKSREKFKLIVEQADRMTHIIEHVRMFAREAGKPEVRAVDINDVVVSAISLLGEQFRVHGLTLKSELTDGLPPVLVNPFSLEEVILNLLSNARDAVEERMKADQAASSEILLRTCLDKENKKRPVKIQVIDRGIGISDELIPKIVDPFFTTKEPDKGTGLGLSICESITEQFGGKIKIESQPSEGTTVTVSLPEKDWQEEK